MERSEAEDRLQFLTWVATAAAAFLLVFTISMMGLMLWQASRQGATAAEVKTLAIESHNSLCAFTGDLQARYDSSEKLLSEHPGDPVRVFGLVVPRDQLLTSQAQRKATLDSLSGLDCS